MAGFKINRITSDIKIAVSDILREIKDPRISKLLSVVKVDVSNDLSYAAVYVSAIEGIEKTKISIINIIYFFTAPYLQPFQKALMLSAERRKQ